VRRFTLDPSTLTMAALDDMIARLFDLNARPLPFALKYTDEEGDRISINSDYELAEAIATAQTAIPPLLRLHLEAAEIDPAPASTRPPRPSQPSPQVWEPASKDDIEDMVALRDQHEIAEIYIRSRELMKERTPAALHEASTLLQEIAEGSPQLRKFAFYKIAWCEAQLGRPETALEALQLAVTVGWRNVSKLQRQEFECVRDLPGFLTLIETLERDDRNIEDDPSMVGMPSNEVEPVSEEAADIPVEAVEASEPDNSDGLTMPVTGVIADFKMKLNALSEMGFTSRFQNMIALVLKLNNIDEAVQWLLESVDSA